MQHLEKVMKRSNFALLKIAAGLAGTTLSVAGSGDTRDSTYSLFPMEQGPHFLIRVGINGQPEQHWIVDTGASNSVISRDYAKNIGLELPRKPVIVSGNDSGGRTVHLEEIRVQSVSVDGKPNNTFDLWMMDFPKTLQDLKIVGILSPQSAFAKQAFLIDGLGRKLYAGEFADRILHERAFVSRHRAFPCENHPTYDTYMIEAKIEGIEGKFYLDTGGGLGALNPGFAKKFGKKKGEVFSRTGMGGDRQVTNLSNLKFESGGLIALLTMSVEPNSVSCDRADGKLGNDFLGRLGLYFSSDRSEVIFIR
jgi:hypothetical protein